ncbi:MAG: MBOAT family O-acyltransferase [Burkholderiaceae bacterium]
MISSNSLLLLPLLAALLMTVRQDRLRLALIAMASVLVIVLDGLADALILFGLLGLCFGGTALLVRMLPGSRAGLSVLVCLEIAPLLAYKLLRSGLIEWLASIDPALTLGLTPPGETDWLPPLGLSVITFQAVSYTVDRWRSQLPAHGSLHYLVYMGFFPHLAAGPILRASDFMGQLLAPRQVSTEDVREGLWRIFCGLTKKLLVADVIARAGVNPVFSDPSAFSTAEISIALLAYTLQIFLDFSGYTDVVIGAGRLMGLKLPENFDRPYHATSIADYWRRWHMSLSAWVSHYVYRPLGGNRVVPWKLYRNVMISIVLLAVWHGLTPNFLLYGLLHGTAVCLNRALLRTQSWVRWTADHPWLSGLGGWILTFAFVVIARILFRTPDLASAAEFTQQWLGSELSGLPRYGPAFWACLLAAFAITFAPSRLGDRLHASFLRRSSIVHGALFALVLMGAAALSDGQALHFIYRQF